MILRDLPDLPSLYKFICASSKVNAAFTIDAANILNEIIERSIPHFKPLARVISVIGSLDNTDQVQGTTFKDFQLADRQI